MANKFDDALIGRAILARAILHIKDSMRHDGLACARSEENHIEMWKRAMLEGPEEAGDALKDMVECPLCSSIIAAWQARKLMKGKLGRISGGLTLAGRALRLKRFPPPQPEPSVISVIDNDFPF